MEAKKVRKGVGIRFAPVRRLLDMQTTKRLQRSLASYFFPPFRKGSLIIYYGRNINRAQLYTYIFRDICTIFRINHTRFQYNT